MIDAKEYGKALFLLTEESGVTDGVREQLSCVSDVLTEYPAYQKLLDTPALPAEEKTGLLDEAFAGFQPYLLNFLKILAEKRAVYAFPKAKAAFDAAYDEARGIERVEAFSAVPMTKAQLDTCKKKLEAGSGKTVILENRVDPSVLGGVRLCMKGKQIDGTLRARLSAFEAAMQKTIV